jgi:hypothetical protein
VACAVAGLASCDGAIALAATTPFGGTPVALPGTIQAANFDEGGEGVAYHDTTSGNTGGAYRATDVDLQASSEGGYNIGWIGAGEWVNYTVSVPAAGNYTATLRVASPAGGGSLHIGFNGPSSVWRTVTVPMTGDWQSWTSVVVPVTLGAGVQQMTLLRHRRLQPPHGGRGFRQRHHLIWRDCRVGAIHWNGRRGARTRARRELR